MNTKSCPKDLLGVASQCMITILHSYKCKCIMNGLRDITAALILNISEVGF